MMKKIIASTLITLTIFLGGLASSTHAEELVLCIGHADQYIVTVNEKGDCVESEIQIVLSGSGMESKKGMTPVANFTEDDKCDGEGHNAEIGFDENENGELDKNEIVSTAGKCMPLIAEDTEPTEE